MNNTQTSVAHIDLPNSHAISNIKVFVVEDDQMISELVVAKLLQSGCVPYSTTNGSDALRIAEEYKPDVIILDLMLPGMTGEEILTALKANVFLKDIPVVIFSNKSEDMDKQKILDLGAARYYVKAYTDLNELVAELKILANR